MAAPATTAGITYGVVSDAALASVALSDAELNEMSSTPPPTSTRDRGWYRAASRVRLSLKSERQSTFPKPRALAEGAAGQRVVQGLGGIQGERFAARLMSVEAGRPWALDRLRMVVEFQEGTSAGESRIVDIPALVGGVDRSKQPTQIGLTKAWDLRNASFQGDRFRSRRGYAVVNNASDDVEAKPSAYYDATDAAGDTYHLVLIAGTLYTIDNGELIELDTGWPEDELPTVATVGLKTFIACRSKVRVFMQGTLYTPGIAAPTDKPLAGSPTPNVTGGVVGLAPGYEYVYTFYDGTRLTESGPSDITRVVLPAGSSASSIPFSLSTSASPTVTERRLYRRKWGTDTWFRVATVEDNTTTTDAVTDASELPPDINATLDSPNGFFVTADFPEGASVAAVEGRLLVFQNPDDKRLVRVSEVGDGERHFPFNEVTCDGDCRAIVTHEGRAVALTDRTVEVIEGDWVRGTAGTLGIQRRVLDKSKGVFGPFAACSARGHIYFCDQGGIHILGVGMLLKDSAETISDEVQEIVAAAVDTAGSGVVMEFNHVSQELWVLLSQATGDVADPKNRVVLTLNLKNGSWAIHDHALSFIRRVFDGTLGARFMATDYFGDVLELDVYNGDGIQGNEDWFPSDDTITAFDATAKTVTVDGATFPDTLRGVSVVLEDVSEGLFYRRTILASSGDDLTLDALFDDIQEYVPEDASDPDNVIPAIPGDRVHIGGILSYFDTRENDGGRSVRKKLTNVELSLADCTEGRF